jgi:hypothetical protein
MSWAAVRDGLRDRLRTIDGLSAFDTMPPALPDRDSAVVLPGEPLLEPFAHRDTWALLVRVAVRCQRATVRDAQDALDEYVWPVGRRSIVAAVQADPTLGGVADDTAFLRVDGYGAIEGQSGTVQAEVWFRVVCR